MAIARVTSSYGNAPGYGKVSAPKKSSMWGGLASSYVKAAPAFKAQSYTPPAVAGASAAPAPAAPKFDPNNLPVDPTYDAQVGGLRNTRDDSLAGLTQQRKATLLDYGYNVDDANTTLTFDPTNVNSRAAQMKKRYDQSKTGTANSMAARGQFGGALTNAQGANDSNYSSSSDSLQKSLLSYLANNQLAQKSAGTNFETGVGVAGGDRIARALAASQANTQAPTSQASSGASSAPTTADLIKQWQTSGAKTTYANDAGHPVRVLQNGTKEVFVNGKWKRV